MTLHSAKGLEFDTVFLPGWEEGLFPSQRTLDENGRAGLEEERRLAYVGITRARKRANIRFAANRRIHGLWQIAIPSRFLDELPEAHVEVVEEAVELRRLRHAARYGASRFDLRDPFAEHLRDARLAARAEEPRPATATATMGGKRRLRRSAVLGPAPDRGRAGGEERHRRHVATIAVGERVFHQKFGYGRDRRDRRQQAHHRLRQGRAEAGARQFVERH